jgi:hypothetical protein
MQKTNRNNRDIIKIFGLLVAIAALFFGNNIFQQYTGKSFFDYLRNLEEPLYNSLNSSFSVYTDEGDFNNTETPSQNSTNPTIVYCLDEVQYGNPDSRTTIFTNFETTIMYGQENITLKGEDQTELLQKTPDSPFNCVGSSIAFEKPDIGINPDSIIVPFDLGSPTSTPAFPQIFNPLSQAMLQCAQDPYRVRLTEVKFIPANTPIVIDNQIIFNFYVLTTFYLKADKYKYSSSAMNSYSPITIESELTDTNGKNLSLGKNNCFYYR